MNFASSSRARTLWLSGAACAIVLFSGCQGEKIVAHVGPTSITEKDFNERALRLTQGETLPTTDVGGATLVHMIQEQVIKMMADDKKISPTPEEVTKFATYQTRINPQTRKALADGTLELADFEPSFRDEIMLRRLGSDGELPKPEDMKKEYDDLVKQEPSTTNPLTGQQERNPIKLAETFTVKAVLVRDLKTAQTALAAVKANGDFKAAALAAGNPPQQAEGANNEQPIPGDAVKKTQPDLYKGISALTAGQYASEPLPYKIPGPDPKDPKKQIVQTAYVVLQLVSKEADYTFPYEEAQTAIEGRLIDKTHPDWRTHATKLVGAKLDDMMKANSIQINVPRYTPLLDKVFKKIIEDAKNIPATPAAQPTPQPVPQPQPAAETRSEHGRQTDNRR